MRAMMKSFIPVAMLAIAAWGGSKAWAQGDATVHGHVQNPAGLPVKGAVVEFSKDTTGDPKDRKYPYKFTVDDNGDYKGTGIAAGTYFTTVTADGKFLDYTDSVKFDAGADVKLDFDMTRKEYIDKMTPEEKQQLEDFKKKNAATSAANKMITNLNATLIQVRADLKAAAPPAYGDVSKDVSDMKNATDAKPDESILWIEYADTLQAQGDHLAHADKAAGKSAASDDDVTKNYTDAIAAYQKGADLNAASKKPAPGDQAVAYNQMGNLYGKMGKAPDASAAFDKAVALDPTKASMYYNNEAAILYNNGQYPGALDAAEKAIAADPNRADPYYIKGQVLIQKATLDPKTQKLVAPDGCVDAYQHFLGLAPDSPRAADVKAVLASMGETISTKYNSTTKKK